MKKEFVLDEDCYHALATSIYGNSYYPVSFMYNGYVFTNKKFTLAEEPKLMTRKEAIRLTHGELHNISTINILEALGLIKFKEEKKHNIRYILVEGYQVNVDSMETVQVSDKDLIKIMEKEGYTVTKNG